MFINGQLSGSGLAMVLLLLLITNAIFAEIFIYFRKIRAQYLKYKKLYFEVEAQKLQEEKLKNLERQGSVIFLGNVKNN